MRNLGWQAETRGSGFKQTPQRAGICMKPQYICSYFFISLLVSLSVQQKGILVSAPWHTVEQDLSVWRSRSWGSGQLDKLHFKTLQSESRGKWGSDQAKQKKLRSRNQHTFFVPGMQRTGGSELGLHPALTGWETLPISQILKVLNRNLSRRNAIFENIYLPVLKI